MNINYIPEEDKIIREMAAAGKTPEQIATVLITRSQDSISMYCYRRGIKFKAYQPEINMVEYRKLMGGK